jgi:tRNA G18 (ribose-2'-O)-methylase SpoU
MNALPVDSIDDPRLAPYRPLKDRELAREGNRFIAEGEHVVRRLLASDFPVESVLLSFRRADEISPLVPPAVPVYVAADELLRGVIGYKFHSGVIACGRRKQSPALEEIASSQGRTRTRRLVVLPEISNTENLGALIRISAAFGADAVILGEKSCDPFFRQCIRVSMGTVFRLPICLAKDIQCDLLRLRDEFEVELIASVLDEAAEPLAAARTADRIAILFGNEAQGLPQDQIKLCDRTVTIPMKLGTDSLNVAVAAALFLYQFTR